MYRPLKQLIGESGIYGTTGEKYFITISSQPFLRQKQCKSHLVDMCCAVGCTNWQDYSGKRFSLLVDRKFNAKSGILPRKWRHKLLTTKYSNLCCSDPFVSIHAFIIYEHTCCNTLLCPFTPSFLSDCLSWSVNDDSTNSPVSHRDNAIYPFVSMYLERIYSSCSVVLLCITFTFSTYPPS